MLNSLEKYRDFGLLVLRIGIGLSFVYRGWPKMSGGMERWEQIGGAMAVFGIAIVPVFWGFLAAFSEFIGGMAIAAGLFFRPACLLLLVTMIVAAASHLDRGDGLGRASHAIEMAVVFFSFLFLGAGRLSLDEKLNL